VALASDLTAAEVVDVPIPLKRSASGADRVFRVILAGCGTTVLVVLGAVVVYLVHYSDRAFHKVGFGLITSSHWAPPFDLGILGALVGSVVIALLALTVALPLSVASALMINEYAPKRLRGMLVSLIDLLATVPSIVYGFWGLIALQTYLFGTTKFLARHFGFIPLFRTVEPNTYGLSVFDCGLVVAIMIIPIVTSISREVMARAPREPCEGALALGGTRWGMVTDVILPYSRNGIIGAALLGLGRAVGETMAVYLILSTTNILTPAILGPNGLGSITYLISRDFTSNPTLVKSALTEAGLALFATTLAMNLVARLVVTRSDEAYA